MTKSELYEQLIVSLPDGLFIVDGRGIIEFANPCAEELFGYDHDEMRGMNINVLMPADIAATHDQKVHHYMEQPKKRAMGAGKRFSGLCKDGTVLPVSISLNPTVMDGEMKVIALVRDKREYEALELQLEQAQKMEEVGSLAAGITHDFNNVLAAITCQTYLIRNRLADFPDLVNELISIEDHAFEAADMIRQLLTFARKKTMKKTLLSLRTLVTEALRLHTSTLPSSIIVELDICADKLMVQADPMQIQQVLLNLLNNAKHAMFDSAEQQLRIALHPFSANETFLGAHPDLGNRQLARISVSDSGHGIAADKLEKIFEPFYTTKKTGQGTGLGLSMIASAIKQCGGVIDVESIVDQGSTFHVYLPLDESDADIAEESRQIMHGEGETILLVDDNEAARKAMARLLVALNYQVIEASDGVMGIDQFASHADQIALVIMDVVMPRMGGLEAARWIRSRRSQALPVLFVTAYDRSNVDHALDNSFALSKPVPIYKLSQSIRSLLPDRTDDAVIKPCKALLRTEKYKV